MTDADLEKLAFIIPQVQAIGAGLGGNDGDLILIAAVTRAMVMAPKHTMSPVDRVKEINRVAGEAEFVIRGLLEGKKTEENGK